MAQKVVVGDFNRYRRLRQNYVSRRDAPLFALHEVLSEYAKIILVHMENSSEENKRPWTIRRSILTHSPCTPIDINVSTNIKNRDPRSSFYEGWDGRENHLHTNVPLSITKHLARLSLTL
jgi:hypothetical protein